MRNFQETTAKQFVLAKFEPGNILLINRYTKKAFNYFQVKNSVPLLQQLKHPFLLRPLFYGNGLLYPKGQSNMRVELENRQRAFNKDYFPEDELINTFSPLFECVEYLHANNVVHGQIHPENIVFVNEEIKLRDWLIEFHDNAYYSNSKKENRNKFDDFVALGQIMTQYATLRKSPDPFEDRDIPAAIESIIDSYSKNFIILLLVLLKRKTQYFKDVLPLIQAKSNSLIENVELNTMYSKIKVDKENKAIKLQPVQKVVNIMPTPKKTETLPIQSSPTKKFNITHASKKSSHRLDDTENKKVFNEQVKKRQIQKITKIIERSNAFVNELMARKNNAQFGTIKNNSQLNTTKNVSDVSNQQVLKKISGKNNINLGLTMNNMSIYTVQPSKKQKQTTAITFSPNKRLRTISKKK